VRAEIEKGRDLIMMTVLMMMMMIAALMVMIDGYGIPDIFLYSAVIHDNLHPKRMIEKEGIFVHSHFCFQIIISFICNYVKR
jgi:hypothetical protein